jgi:uncharacterized membrane protein YsdA (DUF1294 family)
MPYVSILVFAAMLAYTSVVLSAPHWIAGLYAIASLVCFIAYAADKSAARAGRWRTSEATLLMLGLACGWPGGVLAQQCLRHKSVKATFRTRFWITVGCNVAVFVYLSTPLSLRPL